MIFFFRTKEVIRFKVKYFTKKKKKMRVPSYTQLRTFVSQCFGILKLTFGLFFSKNSEVGRYIKKIFARANEKDFQCFPVSYKYVRRAANRVRNGELGIMTRSFTYRAGDLFLIDSCFSFNEKITFCM